MSAHVPAVVARQADSGRKPPASRSAWFVYLLRCADGTLYTGITTDVDRRLAEHNGNHGLGARYTRSRRPVTLA
jgi:putative endonuclease